MSKFSFPDSFAYRHRYQLGYAMVAIALLGAILFSGLYLPGGITNAETQAVVHSSTLNFKDLSSLNLINLPYYLLQKAGFSIFGVSILTIKLPSMILAFLSAIGLVLLLKKWLRSNVAVLASLIALTTGQFLFIAQNGTPDVLFIFWPIWLMFLVSSISSTKKHQVIYGTIFCIAAALSLYTPLGIYPLIIFTIAMLIHPHLRHVVKKIPKCRLIPGFLAAAIILLPLSLYISKMPSAVLTLLGVPTSAPNLCNNISTLTMQYLNFASPGGTTAITPFFELGSILIICLGFYRLYEIRATAKSYVLSLWILCLVPLVILNPSYTNYSFLPLVILLAAGINWLLLYWYGLFPNNPYARVAGLIPIIVLVAALILSGVSRYAYTYKYDPDLTYSFSNDIRLIPKDTKNLVVSKGELDFYKAVQKYNDNFAVSLEPTGQTFLATREASKNSFNGYSITRIITNAQAKEADRFYLYKK